MNLHPSVQSVQSVQSVHKPFNSKAFKPLCTVQTNRAKCQKPCKQPERHQKQKSAAALYLQGVGSLLVTC
jgi:hypothetical protein